MNEITTELLEKYVSDNANPEEQKLVETWLRENDLSREQLTQFLQLPDGVKMMLRNEPERVWKEKVRPAIYPGKQRWLIPVPMRIAATVILLIGAAAVFFLLNSNNNNRQIIANNSPVNKTVVLPDSSLIYLHSGSEIEYDESYSDNRNITMKGQAFFEVKRDPQHPFTVAIGQSVVQVLDTSFNINDDTTRLDVTVATGKVSVEIPIHELVYLEKGEMASYDKSALKITQRSNDDLNFDSWKTKKLQFKDTPLLQVVSTLSEHFDLKITVDKNKAASITYTSDFTDPTLQEVLLEMKDVLGIDYQESGKKIIAVIP